MLVSEPNVTSLYSTVFYLSNIASHIWSSNEWLLFGCQIHLSVYHSWKISLNLKVFMNTKCKTCTAFRHVVLCGLCLFFTSTIPRESYKLARLRLASYATCAEVGHCACIMVADETVRNNKLITNEKSSYGLH